jgi:competence protein ComFC
MRVFDFILNLLFPPRCVSCKREGDFLCTECIKRLKIKDLRLKKKNPSSEKEWKYMDGVIYALDYAENPQIQAAIQQFKYRFTKELVEYFGDLIAQKLRELSMNKGKTNILIPVPLHKKRLNYRGFNQAELIAKAVCERVGDSRISHLLRRVKNTSQQAKLNKKERLENLEDAFSYCGAAPSSRGANCGAASHGMDKHPSAAADSTIAPQQVYFIVDDVCTTGSTLENCAKVLKESGIKKVYGLVVARAFK